MKLAIVRPGEKRTTSRAPSINPTGCPSAAPSRTSKLSMPVASGRKRSRKR